MTLALQKVFQATASEQSSDMNRRSTKMMHLQRLLQAVLLQQKRLRGLVLPVVVVETQATSDAAVIPSHPKYLTLDLTVSDSSNDQHVPLLVLVGRSSLTV